MEIGDLRKPRRDRRRVRIRSDEPSRAEPGGRVARRVFERRSTTAASPPSFARCFAIRNAISTGIGPLPPMPASECALRRVTPLHFFFCPKSWNALATLTNMSTNPLRGMMEDVSEGRFWWANKSGYASARRAKFCCSRAAFYPRARDLSPLPPIRRPKPRRRCLEEKRRPATFPASQDQKHPRHHSRPLQRRKHTLSGPP